MANTHPDQLDQQSIHEIEMAMENEMIARLGRTAEARANAEHFAQQHRIRARQLMLLADAYRTINHGKENVF